MYDLIKENRLKNGHCKKPESRETFSKLLGIASSAVKKAIRNRKLPNKSL